MGEKPSIQIAVRAFFISDKLDVDLAPKISMTTNNYESASQFVTLLAEKLAKTERPLDLLKVITGTIPDELVSEDWRAMTAEEIKEYLATE